MNKSILVTGGAGFIGSNLALALKRTNPDYAVLALDNLKRRGSELSISRLRAGGVDFIHGDIRNFEDLDHVEAADIILECSAEPSVQAGFTSGARYLVNTNLLGTVNCLEFAARCDASIIFLSTSRVYPIAAMRNLPLDEIGDRFEIRKHESGRGWSAEGISTDFPLAGGRSLYGATKLCSEILTQEYAEIHGLKAVINRCGVITGPWQMGKVDQGFVTHWAARYFFGGTLDYTGFGGHGLQVRDILHVDDLFELINIQMNNLEYYKGQVFNVGGGSSNSVSLLELSRRCADIIGRTLNTGSRPSTNPSDIPYYVSDNSEVTAKTGWKPKRSVDVILMDIFAWIKENQIALKGIIG